MKRNGDVDTSAQLQRSAKLSADRSATPGPADPAADGEVRRASGDDRERVRRELGELARRAAGGDEDAFECLHRGLQSRVAAFFRRRIGAAPELVEELSQRTWIEVWKSLQNGYFDPSRASFGTYLLGIGSKVFLRHCRTEKRIRHHASAAETLLERTFTDREEHGPAAEAERLMDLCSNLEALRDCVARAQTGRRLSALDVEILKLVLEERSEREIAEQLGVAPSTVNARKQASIELFRRCLARKGIR